MPEEASPAANGKPAAAGTLPIAALNNAAKAVGTQRNAAPRPPAVKLKVVIRRLPPGLTRLELELALGDEWKVGAGRTTWATFNPGKSSKDLAKPSRPARMYLQLSEHCHLEPLATLVQTTTFTDARNTVNDPALVGPPVLEFAIYQRTPTLKKRHDARQGLIDQDAEFIEFLESLTNPTIRPQNIDASKEGKDEPVRVTPLIQHLRDKKKAAKEKSKGDKASKSGRGSKAATATADAKAETKSKDAVDKSDAKSGRRRKADGAKKEITIQQPPQAVAAASTSTKPDQVKPTATEGKKRERPAGGAGAAASLIHRDLGLRGGRAEGGRRGGAKGSAGRNGTSENAPPASSTETTPTTKPAASGRNPKAAPTSAPTAAATPSVLKRQPPNAPPSAAPAASRAASSAAATPQAKSASISPTATQAFLKHANPSQGITEANLLAALSVYGSVSKVDIDKRKGFAYASFAEPKGLQAAAAAGLIPVAQGNVQVLERKERSKPSAVAGGSSGSTSTPAASIASSGTPAAQTGSAGGRNAGGARGGGRAGRARGGNARGGASSSAAASASTSAAAASAGGSQNVSPNSGSAT